MSYKLLYLFLLLPTHTALHTVLHGATETAARRTPDGQEYGQKHVSQKEAKAQKKHADAARKTVTILYEKAKKICQKKDTDQKKMEHLKKLVDAHWDLEKIAAYIMHPNWKNFSESKPEPESEKHAFLRNLKNKIVKIFFSISKKYLNDFAITKVSPVKGKKNAFDVHCEVKNKDDNQKVVIRFQIVNKLVRNIYVETLSLVDAAKQEYKKIFRKQNKKIPDFLKALSSEPNDAAGSKTNPNPNPNPSN